MVRMAIQMAGLGLWLSYNEIVCRWIAVWSAWCEGWTRQVGDAMWYVAGRLFQCAGGEKESPVRGRGMSLTTCMGVSVLILRTRACVHMHKNSYCKRVCVCVYSCVCMCVRVRVCRCVVCVGEGSGEGLPVSFFGSIA